MAGASEISGLDKVISIRRGESKKAGRMARLLALRYAYAPFLTGAMTSLAALATRNFTTVLALI